MLCGKQCLCLPHLPTQFSQIAHCVDMKCLLYNDQFGHIVLQERANSKWHKLSPHVFPWRMWKWIKWISFALAWENVAIRKTRWKSWTFLFCFRVFRETHRIFTPPTKLELCNLVRFMRFCHSNNCYDSFRRKRTKSPLRNSHAAQWVGELLGFQQIVAQKRATPAHQWTGPPGLKKGWASGWQRKISVFSLRHNFWSIFALFKSGLHFWISLQNLGLKLV